MRPRARRSSTNDNPRQDAPGSGVPAVVRRGPRLAAGVVVAFLLAGGAQVGGAGAAEASVGPVTVGSLTAAASGHHRGDHPKADPSPSLDPSPSSTHSPSASADPSPSASSDPGPSHDPSPTPDPTPTSDPSATPSPTSTPSPKPSPTPSPEPSPKPSPEPSPKPGPSSEPSPSLTPDLVPGSPSAGSPSVVPAPAGSSPTVAPSPTAVARALGAGRVTASSDPLARFRSPSAQPSRPRHQSPDASLVVAKTRQPTAASARPSPGDARAASSSAAISNDGPFRWTPLYVGWAAATVVALIALAVGPGALDRWRRR
jgi:hypothetical protein